MVATVVTLNDLEGHSPVADVFKCNQSRFVQHFKRFQLTVCSHDSSALAELLVTSSSAMAERPRELDQRFQMGGQFEAIID